MSYFRTDPPDPASELFGGGAVIAHHGAGLRFSLSASGALTRQALRHRLAQELLLLDPVHDVTEAGWPRRPDDQT